MVPPLLWVLCCPVLFPFALLSFRYATQLFQRPAVPYFRVQIHPLHATRLQGCCKAGFSYQLRVVVVKLDALDKFLWTLECNFTVQGILRSVYCLFSAIGKEAWSKDSAWIGKLLWKTWKKFLVYPSSLCVVLWKEQVTLLTCRSQKNYGHCGLVQNCITVGAFLGAEKKQQAGKSSSWIRRVVLTRYQTSE